MSGRKKERVGTEGGRKGDSKIGREGVERGREGGREGEISVQVRK